MDIPRMMHKISGICYCFSVVYSALLNYIKHCVELIDSNQRIKQGSRNKEIKLRVGSHDYKQISYRASLSWQEIRIEDMSRPSMTSCQRRVALWLL